MGVSKNMGTPKWMVYNGKAYKNGWFGGTPIFGKHPYTTCWYLPMHQNCDVLPLPAHKSGYKFKQVNMLEFETHKSSMCQFESLKAHLIIQNLVIPACLLNALQGWCLEMYGFFFQQVRTQQTHQIENTIKATEGSESRATPKQRFEPRTKKTPENIR